MPLRGRSPKASPGGTQGSNDHPQQPQEGRAPAPSQAPGHLSQLAQPSPRGGSGTTPRRRRAPPWPRSRIHAPRLSRSPDSLRDTAWAEPRRASWCRQRPLGPRPSGPGDPTPLRRTPPKHCCQEANKCRKPLMRLPKRPPARSDAPRNPAPGGKSSPGHPLGIQGGSPIHRGSCGLGGGPGVPRGLGPWGALGQGLSAIACWWNWLRGLAWEGFSLTEPWHIVIVLLLGFLAAPRGFTEPMPRPLRQRRLPGPLIASGQGPLTRATRALIPPAKGCSSPGARAVPTSMVPGLRG